MIHETIYCPVCRETKQYGVIRTWPPVERECLDCETERIREYERQCTEEDNLDARLVTGCDFPS
jgi:hypothetical protein